jgi:predicted nucleotide-binding protein (sugar kinase/HSP70/actin superfamily)
MYVVLEPFVNMNLEVELGKLGVEANRTRTTYLSEWTTMKAYLHLLDKEKEKLAEYACPYMRRDVGGHGLESLGEKIRMAREGYDGVVHVTPFTCMPETIAENIMPTTIENIPVLTMICDEQMSKAGVLTRLEAFVDLLESRRRNARRTAVKV